MNNHQMEEQARLQLLAEQAEKQGLPPGGNAALDGYRLVVRALRQPLAQQLPADFAARVAARVAARAGAPEESTRLEDWLMSLLLLVLAGTGLFYVQPVMAEVFSQLHVRLPAIPWPLLGAAAASVAVAWALDRGAIGWHQRPHGP